MRSVHRCDRFVRPRVRFCPRARRLLRKRIVGAVGSRRRPSPSPPPPRALRPRAMPSRSARRSPTGAATGIDMLSISASAVASYTPAACLTVTNDTSTGQATYVLRRLQRPATGSCTSPARVNGARTPRLPENELSLTFAAPSLQVNGATVDWTASATVTTTAATVVPATRDMVWDGHFTGNDRRRPRDRAHEPQGVHVDAGRGVHDV